VREHSWGRDVDQLEPPFEFIFACDVMYIHELVQPLVASLVALSGPSTEIYVAHGRNRQVGGAAGGAGRRWAARALFWALQQRIRCTCRGDELPILPPRPSPSATAVLLPTILQAYPEFAKAAQQYLTIEPVPPEQLDEVYQCSDVDVLLVRLHRASKYCR
jgi:hypothetical protein